MIRTTITIDEELAAGIDAYIQRSAVVNRSEAIRDLVRRGLAAGEEKDPGSQCIGVISYTMEQTMPGLAKRVRDLRLSRHDEIAFVASVPVSHQETIDIAVLKGTVERVGDFAAQLFLEKGVRHGGVVLTPVEVEVMHHAHDDGEPHAHQHLRVQESF